MSYLQTVRVVLYSYEVELLVPYLSKINAIHKELDDKILRGSVLQAGTPKEKKKKKQCQNRKDQGIKEQKVSEFELSRHAPHSPQHFRTDTHTHTHNIFSVHLCRVGNFILTIYISTRDCLVFSFSWRNYVYAVRRKKKKLSASRGKTRVYSTVPLHLSILSLRDSEKSFDAKK